MLTWYHSGFPRVSTSLTRFYYVSNDNTKVDIDILKPDTGKMHIERPSHSQTASAVETPEVFTPDYEARPYNEPVSEGEDDEYENKD